jgi:tetratricopeptide (TPR) repeat protein
MMRRPWMTTTIAVCAAFAASVPGCKTVERFPGPPEPPTIETAEPSLVQLEQLEMAETAKEEGDYDEALRLFQDLLAENPTITTAYLGIGDIYMVKEDYAKAEPAYGRAARLEPESFDAQFGHGLALQMLRRFVEAVRAYQRALDIRPADMKANLNLATVFLQMNQPERAVRLAERAVEANPASGPARANLGAIYEKLGRYAEAVDAYDAALELMGNEPRLMMNQINVLTRQKRYREAANTALALVKIEPSAEAYERLGWCYFKLKEYEKSLEAYRTAVDIDPTYWPALNGVGVNALNAWLLSDRQDKQAKLEARDAFRRSLRVRPDQQRVIKLLLNYSL